MAESILLSRAQIAEMVDLSVRRIAQLCRDGEGPPQTPDGKFRPADFAEWFRARIVAEQPFQGTDGQPVTLRSAQLRLVDAQARKAELEAAELAKELIRVEDVRLTWGGMVAAVRAKMLALPSRIAQAVAPPGKMVEAQAQTQDLVYEALHELAGDGVPADRKSTPDSGSGDAGAAAAADGEPMGGRASAPVKRVKRAAREVANLDG